MTAEMLETIIQVAVPSFAIGGMFGFFICALLASSKDDKENKK